MPLLTVEVGTLTDVEVGMLTDMPLLTVEVGTLTDVEVGTLTDVEVGTLTDMLLLTVEVGTLICKEDNHMYEETETTTMHIPFKKTNFTDTPRLIFSLRGVSVDDFNSVRLESLQVNRTGFTVRCSYFGKWMHYSMEFSWLAVGR